jgi:hypothetical protein
MLSVQTVQLEPVTMRSSRRATNTYRRPNIGVNHKVTSPGVVLLCSGKNCLDSAVSASTPSGVRTVSGMSNGMDGYDTQFSSRNGVIIDDVNGIPLSARGTSNIHFRKANSSVLLTSARDPLSSDLCTYRLGQSYWLDNTTGCYDDSVQDRQHSSSRREAKMMAATMAAERVARRHIWACQLPGSVKRSCRVTSGLSDLMATLNDQNWVSSSGSTPRRSAVSSSTTKNGLDHHGRRPSDSSASGPVVRPQTVPLVVACSIDGFQVDGRPSGSRRSTASSGRQSTTLVRGIGGTTRQQAQLALRTSSLTTANADPLLCITSLGSATGRVSGTRIGAAGVRTDRRKAERPAVNGQAKGQSLEPSTNGFTDRSSPNE